MVLTVLIDSGNEAVQSAEDVARILRNLAKRIEDLQNYASSGKLMDHNGNSVGKWAYNAEG